MLAVLWIFSRVDYGRLVEVVRRADLAPLLVVPAAVAVEQVVRAWKWRQILHSLKPVPTMRLFGAVMAGYFVTMIIPLGISPLVRSWLIARLEDLTVGAVLATAAVERLVDGLVFSGFVALALALAVFPDQDGYIRLGLGLGVVGGLTLFSLLLFALSRFRASAVEPHGWPARALRRLPARVAEPGLDLLRSFAAGIVWPRERWRGLAIVLAAVTMKLVSLSHFFWAGLGFGVVLDFAGYLFLVAFLGVLLILSRLTRIPGGFFLGAVFALDLLGVAEEEALAMVLVVQTATIGTVGLIGALALWRSGLAIGELKAGVRAEACAE